mgnify:CR=1 FL=1
MNNDLNLSDAQLKAYTGKTHRSCQVRVLQFMGIEYKKRPDGSLAVLCQHVNPSIGTDSTKKETEPDWSMV